MGLLLRAVPLLFALSYTNASPLQARQAPDANLTEYITQVKTALYVVNSLEANNQSTACSDAQLASTLDASGYDGEYAQQLLCEAAIGVQLFPDLASAADDMNTALDGLNAADAPASGVARVPDCQTVNVATLDEAGLDGTGIQNAVCRAAAAAISGTLATASSTILTSTNQTSIVSTNSAAETALPVPFLTTTPSALLVTGISATLPVLQTPSAITTVVLSTGNTSAILATGTFSIITPTPIIVTTSSNASTVPVIVIAPEPSFIATSSNTSVALSSGLLGTAASSTLASPSSNSSSTTNLPSVVVVTSYSTVLVAPPVSTSRTSTEQVITVTIDITTTETILITTTVTPSSNGTRPHMSATAPRGPWQWTGGWQPYAYTPDPNQPWPSPTAHDGGEPLPSGVTGNSAAGVPSETCTDEW